MVFIKFGMEEPNRLNSTVEFPFNTKNCCCLFTSNFRGEYSGKKKCKTTMPILTVNNETK